MGNKHIRIIVNGRVQGVFFRKYTMDFAQSIAIQGKVRNLKNGDVEIFAQGTSNQIEKLITWTYQGSPLSKVENVLVEELEKDAEYPNQFYVENGSF